jgi:hypothetical protein
MTPAILVIYGSEAFRRPRCAVAIVAHVALSAWHAGAAAGACFLTFPWSIRMVLTNPAAVGALRTFRDEGIRLERVAQPLHGEFDIFRLQEAPSLDLRQVPVLREALEIILGHLSGGRSLPSELLANEGIAGHALLKRGRIVRASRVWARFATLEGTLSLL